MQNIALLNTTILTGGAGTYKLSEISLEAAREMINESCRIDNGTGITSYVGHESTAAIMTSLLGIPVAFSRNQLTQDTATLALCFKLKGRAPEGVILSVEEIQAIGFQWFVLEKVS